LNQAAQFRDRGFGPTYCWAFCLLIWFLCGAELFGLPQHLGDLDEDGQATVLDVVRLLNHVTGAVPLSPELLPFADVNQDGFITELDAQLIADAVLQHTPLPDVPLTRVLSSSPFNGEGDVSVTRKTILRFNFPLADTTLIGTNVLYAEFGGRRLLSRAELSSDRQKVTLFYLEPMPGGARVRVTFNADGLKDFMGRLLDADGDGVAGGAAIIDFDTANTAPQAGTAITGRIFAAELVPGPGNPSTSMNKPLEGVTITVDGMEETMRTTTDAQGNFQLNPCPVGRFFVHVDGRTAVGSHWPAGDYYPVLGKAWQAVAGRTDNLAAGTGTIYLPLVKAGSLQDVSPTKDTTISFPSSVVSNNPALAGVSITVPANSLYSDDGGRGGQVGIAPVPSDRLPEPLPPGLVHSIDISIQTSGPMNFDRPVPVRFPNLPDPVTGQKLPPGAKSALWSFNHDTGKWEIAGPMTVTADGNYVETDPGVGVRQPGWHGTMPGTEGKFKPPPPKKDPCQGVTTSQIIDTVVDVGVAAVKCVAEFTHVSDGLKQLFNIASEAKKLYDNVQKISDDAKAGKPVKYARDAMKTVQSGKKIFLAGYKLLFNDSPQSPINLVKASLKCAESIASLLDSLCGRFVKGGDGPCSSSIWLQITCIGVGEVKTALVAINNALDKLNKFVEGQAVLLTCSAIDFVATQLGLPPVQEPALRSLSSPPPPPLSDDEPVPPAIIAQIDELAAAAKVMSDGLQSAADLAQAITQFSDKVQSVQDSLTKFYYEQVGSPPNAYYLVEIQGREIRGRTSSQGQIDLILAGDADYTLSIFDPLHGLLGVVHGHTAPNGVPTEIPLPEFQVPDDLTDTDHDGLPDVFERIVGTDPNNPDTNGDGILDGAEIAQGLDPLGGSALSTGIVATAPTPGKAVDICAINDMAVVAELSAGVSVFNVFSGLTPTLVAQVPTPGQARAVSCTGNLIAVADDTAGLAVIDINDPPASKIIHQATLGSVAQAVDTAGNLAFVGLTSGLLVSVDMLSGNVIDRLPLGSGAINDVVFNGDNLYALTDSKLHTVSVEAGALALAGSVDAPGGTAGYRRRLFVGGGIAYGMFPRGYNVFGVTDPTKPTLLTTINTAQGGWRQLVSNGSGIGLATLGATPQDLPAVDLSLYNLGPDGLANQFVTTFPTPGVAYAVSIYNGTAYVADGDSGLQVINYLPYDTKHVPPTISLSASFSLAPPSAEEGKLERITANVFDDVQVRAVEFYVDGKRVGTAAKFPFELRFVTPLLSADKASFTLQAKAIDTGGNATSTPEFVVNLTRDKTPPHVLRKTFPSLHSIAGSIDTVTIYFSKPIDPATITSATVQVIDAGPDKVLGTKDDVVHAASLSYRDNLNAVLVGFGTNLPPGHYQMLVKPPLADLAGNQLAAVFRSDFWVIAGQDSDHDGIPDDVEIQLGLDPFNSDTNGDGIPDGMEDYDHDGLPNAAEILLGLDPKNPHTLDPKILDGDLDLDGDGLSNRREILAGTDPLVADTDGDGWNDEAEVTAGSDPLDPNSKPSMLVSAAPLVRIGLAQFSSEGAGAGLTVAQPPLKIGVGGFMDNLGGGVTVARPPLKIGVPGFGTDLGLTVGQPPLKMKFLTQ
jgi:hypothetical protein